MKRGGIDDGNTKVSGERKDDKNRANDEFMRYDHRIIKSFIGTTSLNNAGYHVASKQQNTKVPGTPAML